MNMVWAESAKEPHLFRAICDYISRGVWGKPRDFGNGVALGVDIDGVPCGGVLFHNYEPDAGVIEMSAAGNQWLNRKVLAAIFGYVFEDCGCQAVVMRVDPDNRRMCRIATAFGFRRTDIPRLRGRDKAEAVFVLGDDQWRCSRFNVRKR